jgi:type VI secretion system protein VasI
LALAPLFLVTPVIAQAPATGQTCARIDDEARRLLCYDLIFRTGANAPDPVTGISAAPSNPTIDLTTAVDGWPLTTSPSPVGPGRFITVTNISSEPMSDSDQMAKLSITCGNNNTSLSFWFPSHYMSDDDRAVSITIDGGKAQSVNTGGYDSMMSVGTSAVAVPLVKQLMDAKTATISASPSSGPKVTAKFTLTGMTQALAPIRTACGW